MRLINDIDRLYDINIRHHQTMKGGYVCPVCSKPYVNEDTFTKHLGEKNCYDLKALVSGTETEEMAYRWYVEIVEEDSQRSIYNVSAFRKDKRYNAIVRAVIFCNSHRERRLMQYLAYMMITKKYKTLNGALSNMLKESNLRGFWSHLQAHSLVEDEVFVDQHKDELINDHHFLTRSLERAELSMHTFMSWDFENIMSTMPIEYKERIQKIAKEII